MQLCQAHIRISRPSVGMKQSKSTEAIFIKLYTGELSLNLSTNFKFFRNGLHGVPSLHIMAVGGFVNNSLLLVVVILIKIFI
jgi:hypothetical protein